jgi:hypothetical protein
LQMSVLVRRIHTGRHESVESRKCSKRDIVILSP